MHECSAEHPIHEVFRAALDRAFQDHRDLYSPEVAGHLRENILVDFLHVDRLYRLRTASGGRVDAIADMVRVAHENEGPERRLEVDRYIGDYVVFMGGFFPAFLNRPSYESRPSVAKVGGLFVSFSRPIDYYIAEGRNAYGRAADTARIFEPESHHMFRRLGERIEGYLGLLADVKRHIGDHPDLTAH